MSQPSANNAEQFKQSFREEAREILVDLESALLELNENRADMELVGRVFRALHTIKGSGSMFGFERLAAFTHNLETAFDQVRNGRLQIGSELIDLTLAALDQIRAMLEEGAGARAGRSRRLRRRFWPRCGNWPAFHRARPRVRRQVPPPTPGRPLSATARCATWHMRFSPGPEMMLNGTNPLLLLRELRSAGRPLGEGQHGGGSAARRTRSGALLCDLGDGAGHRGGPRRHPRCVHLCRGQLRADDRAGSGRRRKHVRRPQCAAADRTAGP